MTNKPNPAVSVILPVYNGAASIAEAVGSVLNQTFPDFELIVVDDGSTDGTQKALIPFKSRLTVLRTDPIGYGAAINAALRYSRGRYIAFITSEDLWEPSKLAQQVAFLDEHPDAALVYTHATGTKPPRYEGDAFRDLLLHGGLVHSTVMLRRLALEVVGTFDESLPALADYDLQLRIARKFNLGCVPQALVKQRHHAEPFNAYTYDEPYQHRFKIYDRLLSEPTSLQTLGLAKKTLMADFILKYIYLNLREHHPEFTRRKIAELHHYSPWRARFAHFLVRFRITSPFVWRHVIKYFEI
ncbi:MAG: glycosyl transferase [Patescibacteria group bacterium]|nr:glycosyl transferase [Patescibacteria group bacterium]